MLDPDKEVYYEAKTKKSYVIIFRKFVEKYNPIDLFLMLWTEIQQAFEHNHEDKRFRVVLIRPLLKCSVVSFYRHGAGLERVFDYFVSPNACHTMRRLRAVRSDGSSAP